MKTVGIIGGIGPESTIEYYRFIISGYRKRAADGSYPPIIINSIDLTQMVSMMEANEFAWVADRRSRRPDRERTPDMKDRGGSANWDL